MDARLFGDLANCAISGIAGLVMLFVGRKWSRLDPTISEKNRQRKSFAGAMRWLGAIVLACALVMTIAAMNIVREQ